MTPDTPKDLFPDEPWEADISQMLSNLGSVEPPPGFIDQAIDHRPLFAGRALVGLLGAASLVFGATLALGAFGQPRLVPELSTLTSGAAIQNSASMSIFHQSGIIELDELPGGERMEIDGRDAWVDAENDVVVVATDDSVVTMVGVTPGEAAELLDDSELLDDIETAPQGFTGVVNRLTAGVGFPDLG